MLSTSLFYIEQSFFETTGIILPKEILQLFLEGIYFRFPWWSMKDNWILYEKQYFNIYIIIDDDQYESRSCSRYLYEKLFSGAPNNIIMYNFTLDMRIINRFIAHCLINGVHQSFNKIEDAIYSATEDINIIQDGVNNRYNSSIMDLSDFNLFTGELNEEIFTKHIENIPVNNKVRFYLEGRDYFNIY